MVQTRVAIIREKSLENDFFSRSGNFDMSQGNVEKMGRVREKLGNFKISLLDGMAKAIF